MCLSCWDLSYDSKMTLFKVFLSEPFLIVTKLILLFFFFTRQ